MNLMPNGHPYPMNRLTLAGDRFIEQNTDASMARTFLLFSWATITEPDRLVDQNPSLW